MKLSISYESAHPVGLCAVQYIEGLQALFTEALDCVEADEQARFESWSAEVESDDLILDLGDRIRDALRRF